MTRRVARAVVMGTCLALFSSVALAEAPDFRPGSPGTGDPYFPQDGNGGYDVSKYLLDVRYDPATDRLTGVATITAHARRDLSRFNLDLDGLSVQSVKVQGRDASWTRGGGELTITPRFGVRKGARFVTQIEYSGVPETLDDGSGFIHTDDGALIIGEPHVAATWFPANDHPNDRAEFIFRVSAPVGLEVVANGILDAQQTRGGWTTWTWRAQHPMATYLAGMAIGELAINSYQQDGIRYWDAIDPDLFAPLASPTSGAQFAVAQKADSAYKRLSRTISVPADGAQLSFWVQRNTEAFFDFFFVEAHTVGMDDWTTLPDLEGHATQDVGFVCPFWHAIHPFLEHYQTAPAAEGEPCAPTGSTGQWWAASGPSDGAEQWTIDLSAWAGTEVEVALTYATDDVVQTAGVFVDDVAVSTGQGTTSFEDDGDVFDGWMVAGAPDGSPGNQNDWVAGTVADVPPPPGEVATTAFARQPEIISFLEGVFGPYPFNAAGGIVDDADLGFALENQTRPIYSKLFFSESFSADAVIVHELAHQWVGDSLTVDRWRHIWLNEGFATYAEWLWSEREGLGTVQEIFDFWYGIFEADSPFWTVTIGDPGPDFLFDFAVYIRGGMTLHQLRLEVGETDFFEILRRWARSHAGGTVTTSQFIALAERVSGQQLDELFDVWLHAPTKPEVEGSALRDSAPGVAGVSRAESGQDVLLRMWLTDRELRK